MFTLRITIEPELRDCCFSVCCEAGDPFSLSSFATVMQCVLVFYVECVATINFWCVVTLRLTEDIVATKA